MGSVGASEPWAGPGACSRALVDSGMNSCRVLFPRSFLRFLISEPRCVLSGSCERGDELAACYLQGHFSAFCYPGPGVGIPVCSGGGSLFHVLFRNIFLCILPCLDYVGIPGFFS